MDKLKNLAEDVLKILKRHSIEGADVIIVNSKSTNIKIRKGKIEELRFSNSKGIGIRIIKNKKSGITSTNDFNTEKIEQQITNMLDMVQYLNQDPFVGLPDKSITGRSHQEIDTYDKMIEVIPMEDKIRITGQLEEEGFKYSKLIKNSEGAQWNDTSSKIVLASTNGFLDGYETTNFTLSLILVAEKNGSRQTDYWYSKNPFFKNLESIGSIAKKAAERAIRKLSPKKPSTCKVPVVLDPDVAADLIGIVATGCLGTRVFMKNSFLAGKLGEKIASDKIKLVDNPLLPSGVSSRPFDDEGVTSRKNVVVDSGFLTKYLCDSYSARKLKHPPTGNGSRTIASDPISGISNFYLEKGEYTPEEIIKSVKNGLYLTHVHWTGVNYVTGDYSRGAEGIWINNGELTYPVQEFTVSGNVLDMLQNIEMVGNDLQFRDNISAPTILIGDITISGR
ncbi:MAG: TldD/PmbA family protein [Candidatus Neomarinimicrobiota bacterium]|nr:MAG: TldD/PmbA family protein [Candidatus Neomarinimicrobiota bacterium]